MNLSYSVKNTLVSPSIFEAKYVLKKPVNIQIDSSYDALLLSLSIAEYREAPRMSAPGRDRPHAHAQPPWPRLSSQQPVGPVTTQGPGSAPGSDAASPSRGSRSASPARGTLLRGRGGAPAPLRPQPRWPPAVCDALSLPSRVHFSSLFGCQSQPRFLREGFSRAPVYVSFFVYFPRRTLASFLPSTLSLCNLTLISGII